MTAVEMDVIALIIDLVDDKGTFFSLLTVNKDVFQCTCKVLYSDPFQFFRHKHPLDEHMQQSKTSLLQLLLSLSPATDDSTNLVRAALDVPLKYESETEVQPTTMLDYLSFIQCIQWETMLEDIISGRFVEDKRSLKGIYLGPRPTIRKTVTWSFCGHQLGQMRQLEVEPLDLERWISVAPHLSRLRILSIAAFHGYNQKVLKCIYSSTVNLVQSLQRHHGQSHLRDCRFSCPSVPYKDKMFSLDMAICKLIHPNRFHGLEMALSPRPMDAYLSD